MGVLNGVLRGLLSGLLSRFLSGLLRGFLSDLLSRLLSIFYLASLGFFYLKRFSQAQGAKCTLVLFKQFFIKFLKIYRSIFLESNEGIDPKTTNF